MSRSNPFFEGFHLGFMFARKDLNLQFRILNFKSECSKKNAPQEWIDEVTEPLLHNLKQYLIEMERVAADRDFEVDVDELFKKMRSVQKDFMSIIRRAVDEYYYNR